MKLDRAGIDYIVAVAKDAGFILRRCETTEEYEYTPKVTLSFEQTREPKPPEEPLFKQAGTVEQPNPFPPKDKSKTLDE
jgi:hypothetical protein